MRTCLAVLSLISLGLGLVLSSPTPETASFERRDDAACYGNLVLNGKQRITCGTCSVYNNTVDQQRSIPANKHRYELSPCYIRDGGCEEYNNIRYCGKTKPGHCREC